MKDVPTSCRAAALVDYGTPLEIVEVQVPADLEPGAIIVETLSATVCATDVHAWEGGLGSKDAAANLPVILGHEMVGRVARLADDVTHDSVGQTLSIGDRIIWSHGFCGHCIPCVIEREPTLCENYRGYMSTPLTQYPYLTGGFAEYCYVFPEAGRVKVPDQISDAVAAASACSLRTIVHGFDRLGALDDRQTVVVQGTGPLGLFAVAKAALSGAANVIAIGGPAVRLDLARTWGATATIDIADTAPAARREVVLSLTAGRGADVVIEVSGAPAAFIEGMSILRSGGRYLIIGQVHSESVQFNPSLITIKHAHLIGTRGASIEHYWRGLGFLQRHADRYDWDAMISATYPLDEINAAFAAMQSWQVIKPALSFS
jgi:threonine dehydrogenase-like Zn-dependent dehydrogenase